MNSKMALPNRFALATLGALTAVAMGQAPQQPTTPFVTHQLKPNIYWIEGGGGNSTVIVGALGVVVVDAKTTKAGGQERAFCPGENAFGLAVQRRCFAEGVFHCALLVSGPLRSPADEDRLDNI